jgi:hypothetical protein
MQHTKQHAHDDVEVLETENPWSAYGPVLPECVSPSPSNQRPRRFDRWCTHSAAALFTIALHILLLSPLLLGSPGRKAHPPLTEGAAASAQHTEAGEFVSMLTFLTDRSITDPDTYDDSAYEVMSKEVDKALQNIAMITQLSSTTQPEIRGSEDSQDEAAPSAEATGDDAGRAKLFGLYMGQVKARVDRAWEHPSAPLAGRFQCKVQIAQGEHGDVKEVTLQRCNGSPAWQVSLVQAIQRASPLPAPPSEKVFTAVLTLNFDAFADAKLVAAAVH